MTFESTAPLSLNERVSALLHVVESGGSPIPELLARTELLIEEATSINDKESLFKLHSAKASQLYLWGKHQEAKALYIALLEECRNEERKSSLPKIYLALGRLHSTIQEDRVALDYIRLSKAAAEEVDDKEMIAEGNLLKGITLAKSQKYNEALEAYNDAARYSFETKNTRRMGAIFFMLAQLHHHGENYQSAKESCELAIKYFSESDNKRGLLIATIRLASIISALGEHTAALETLKEHEHEVTQINLPYISSGFYTIKAEILLAVGEYSHCEEILYIANHHSSESNNPRNFLDLYTIFISLYLKTGRGHEAREYLQRAYLIANQTNDIHWEMKLHRLESDLYAQTGDFKQALSQYILFHEKDKKITTETNEERLSMIRMNHELIEKERETELYRLRSEKLQIELVSKSTHLASESEVLTRLREELLTILREPADSETTLRRIKQKMLQLPSSVVDWQEYDKHFLAAHPNFNKRLLERFPTLTQMEMKVCTLLRVGLTSKEIAHMLALSERSIENHRYRLRKKMQIGEQNISGLLNSI